MLILLILVHFLSQNGSAAPVALPLAPRPSDNTCDDINNCRKLSDIVWGCLATIFASTWVSVHPNVPPPNLSRLSLFWRRLKMMLIGIIAPEIMVGFAARQFLGSRKLSQDPKYRFSMTHGYFFCMGGFVSAAGYPVTTEKQLEDPDLGPKFLNGIWKIRVEEITVRSKGDALSKGVALAQGIWFITQCLARLHQRIAITELEVTTVAFAVMNIFIWLLWWNKPLDVQLPIIIGPPTPLDTQPIIPSRVSRFYRFVYAIGGPRLNDNDYNPLSSTSVPSFWSLPMSDNIRKGIIGITALGGSMFGAIHCAAWNTNFPTATEMWIWRSGSLVIAAIPAVIPLMILLILARNKTTLGETKVGTVIIDILVRSELGPFLIYIPARLILVILPLAALRSLPLSALMDVDWSACIPHI